MPAGERVGEAYVRIHADGGSLDREIRDQFDKVDFDKMSRKVSKEWIDGFADEISKAPNQTKMRDAIAGPLVRGKWLQKEFFKSGGNWSSFRSMLVNEYGQAGKRAGEELERKLINGMSMDQLGAELDNITPLITRMQRDINRELKKSEQDADDWEAAWRRDTQKIIDNVGKISRNLQTETQGMSASLNRTRTALFRFGDSFAKDFGGSINRTSHDFDTWHGRMARFNTRVDESVKHIHRFADVTGKAFGHTARNNFINLIGAGVRGMFLLTTVVPRVVGVFGKFVGVLGTMKLAFTSADTTLKGFGAALQVAGGAASTGIIGLTALAVAAVALVVVIGPLVSIISGLAAALVGLAGSLTLAAAAAGGALLGALLPLAAGAGVVAASFIGMNKAQKALLKTSFAPLKREFSGLGDVARKALLDDIAGSARGIAPVIHGLRPLVRGVANAMGDVFRQFSNAMQGSGFDRFKQDMQGFLPNAVRALGNIFVNVFGGLGGLFRALIPITNRFLSWLGQITGEFSRWVNSDAGQRKMMSFFEKAGTAAKSVGRFIKEAAVAMGTLLSAGAGAGNSIFDSMANKLREFTNYLRANPGAIQAWFANGVSVARNVGNAIMAVVNAFRSLDTPGNRQIGGILLRALTTMAGHAGAVARALGHVFDFFLEGLGHALIGVGNMMNAVDKLTPLRNPFHGMGDDLIKTGQGMREFSVATARAGDSASGAASGFVTMKGAAEGLRATLDQTTGAATRATRELIKQKLAQSGSLGMLNAYGASTRDVITATLGNAEAQGRVSVALRKMGASGLFTSAQLNNLKAAFKGAGAGIRSSQSDLQTWGQALKGIKDKSVRVAIRETGMNPTIAKFKQLVKSQNLTRKEVKIAARALGVDLTRKQLNNLLRDSKKLGQQHPHIKPDVDDRKPKTKLQGLNREGQRYGKGRFKAHATVVSRAAEKSFRGLNNDGKAFNRKRFKARADLQDKGARSKFRSLSRDGRRFSRQKLRAKADVQDKPAKAAFKRLIGDGKKFSKQKIRAKADVDEKKALAGFKKASAAGKKFDRQKIRPRADVNEGPAIASLHRVQNLARSVGRMHVTPSVHINTTGEAGVRSAVSAINAVHSTSATVSITTVHRSVKAARGGIQDYSNERMAVGGIAYSERRTTTWGEAGPEAMVPLNRPLSQVDPSVRWLSAIAQGKAMIGTGSTGKTVNVGGLTVITPTKDPVAVATETVNHLVAKGY